MKKKMAVLLMVALLLTACTPAVDPGDPEKDAWGEKASE